MCIRMSNDAILRRAAGPGRIRRVPRSGPHATASSSSSKRVVRRGGSDAASVLEAHTGEGDEAAPSGYLLKEEVDEGVPPFARAPWPLDGTTRDQWKELPECEAAPRKSYYLNQSEKKCDK